MWFSTNIHFYLINHIHSFIVLYVKITSRVLLLCLHTHHPRKKPLTKILLNQTLIHLDIEIIDRTVYVFVEYI